LDPGRKREIPAGKRPEPSTRGEKVVDPGKKKGESPRILSKEREVGSLRMSYLNNSSWNGRRKDGRGEITRPVKG